MNKKTKSFISGLIAITWAMFLLFGCANSSTDSSSDSTTTNTEQSGSKTVSTTAISISATNTEINATGTATLTATLTPTNSTESVTWSITRGSDKATLSSNSGKSVTLTGKNSTTADATVTVKATSGSKSATKNITVKGITTSDTVTLPTSKTTLSLHECIGSNDVIKTSVTTVNGTTKTNARILKSDLTSLKAGDYIGFTASNVTSFRIDDTDWSSLGAVLIDTTTKKVVQNATNSNGDFIVTGSFVFAVTDTMLSKIRAGTNAWNGCVEFHGTATFSNVYYLTAEASSTPPSTVDNLPTTSVAMAKAMVIGWNLGNTLDADKEATKTNKELLTETSWGMPETTQQMIKAVAQKGFKTIRIPVSWHTHITDSNYTIDSQWMARVKTVVDWAIEENMYVILNVHHDDFSDNDMNSTYGYSVSSNTDIQTTSKNYLSKVWTQIANTFKNYDNRLIFEVLNEPRAIGTSYEWWEDSPQSNVASLSPVIKEYEKTCITAIRNTGANNTNRFIMVPTYAANSDMATGWTIPSDTATDRLIISTHAYTPSDFALKGTTTTFTTAEENAVQSKFDNLYSTYVSQGIGVVIGEASASNKNNDTERAKWISKYFALSKSKGIPVVLWDNMKSYDSTVPVTGENGEFHDWFNRNTCTWWHESLVTSMINLTN